MVSTQEFSSCHLVVAGGYDRANAENIAHYKELFECVETLGLNHNQVTFLRSPCKLRLNWGELPFFFNIPKFRIIRVVNAWQEAPFTRKRVEIRLLEVKFSSPSKPVN